MRSEIEKFYDTPDPWGYQDNPSDLLRKTKILEALKPYKPLYEKSLDIGCGEGWITKDLPAAKKYGIELSDNASQRFPTDVIRIHEPNGKYDLIIATGVMYEHYDHKQFIDWIKKHASGIVLLCNIKEWEVGTDVLGSPVYSEEFPYREFTETLKVYDFTAS